MIQNVYERKIELTDTSYVLVRIISQHETIRTDTAKEEYKAGKLISEQREIYLGNRYGTFPIRLHDLIMIVEMIDEIKKAIKQPVSNNQ